MSAFTTATGNIGQEPEIKYSQKGTAYLNLSLAVTPRRFNKQNQQWENRGDDAWLRATFFNDDAERLAEVVHKGAKVTISGTLVRNTFNRTDGTVGESWELDNARFLGIVPKPQNTSQASQAAYTAHQSSNTGTWASGGPVGPQNGAQSTAPDPAGNLGNVFDQFQSNNPPF